VLRDRRLPAIDRSATSWATLIVVALLAALPAAAQARTFKIEGVVTGPPAARGGAVTVPFKVTPRVGRALNLGTRNVSVRLGRRALLRLSGAGASGASRLSPTRLRAGDRLKGVTSLSRRARMRLRWHYRPSLKLKRAKVIRPAPRPLAPPRGIVGPRTFPLPGFSGIPGPPGTPLGQIAAHLATQASALAARADEAGPLAQRIEAQGTQLETLKKGIEGVGGIEGLTTALESLGTALEGVAGSEALQAQVEALHDQVKALENGISPIDSTLSELDGALDKVRGATQKLVPATGNISAQVAAIQQTAGAQAVVTSLDAGATNLNGRLDTVEAGLGSMASDTAALIAAMASLADTVEDLAGAAESGADLATLTAGVNGLGPDVAALETGFGRLAATSSALMPVADAIKTEAPELEKAVGELCSLVPATCP
jgi:hypothetical protein